MSLADDKDWAQKYLNNPLTDPEPSAETGPGTHHYSPYHEPARNRSPSSSVKLKKNRPSSRESQRNAYPSPPMSASPRHEQFPSLSPNHRQGAFAQYQDDPPSRRSMDQPQTEGSRMQPAHRRRGSSLSSRFPGDQSHQPLEIIRRESKRAHRSPHLKKKHLPGPDTIDQLDKVGGTYHHGGPYDAALLVRNTSFESSPLEAVRGTNKEALRATPKANIKDSLDSHRPLDGVAIVPPGMHDYSGELMDYKEGPNMMIENGGNYKRWPGLDYHPDDIKGKGEPSYTIEKALKDHKHSHRRVTSEGEPSYEMRPTPRRASSADRGGAKASGVRMSYREWEDMRRNNTTGNGGESQLKKRFGSLRRRKVD
ncbi:MAG: hypothetical protein M1833_002575 [Piccolia ochrophora]|nr:MAG: hypothetical protein M1833_002575 [Piccolia ochrophora]